MKKIKVAIVDDNRFDRYVVKRKLGKTADFDSTIEAETGDAFLDAVYASGQASPDIEPPQLILMDVNMPGRNGFETIEEIQARMRQGRGPSSVVVMMFTSSQNPLDQQKARESEAVIGYICKPFDDDDINTIRTLYTANVAKLSMENQGKPKALKP